MAVPLLSSAAVHAGRSNEQLSVEAPNLLQDGLEADAMLIYGPQLHLRLRERVGDRLDDWPKFFELLLHR
jgi:hypothetical protein